MKNAWVLLWLGGCAGTPAVVETRGQADVADWVDQVGAILPQAKACAQKTEGPIVGIRLLSSGEIGVMSRRPAGEVIVCVHDGHKVVHLARARIDPADVAQLPFVTLAENPPPQGVCYQTRELFWGSEQVGWVTQVTCNVPKTLH